MSPLSIQQVAQLVLTEIVRQGLGEIDAVDAPCRRARDDVDHDSPTNPRLALDRLEQGPVEVLRRAGVETILGRVGIVCVRRNDELVKLLRYAVHVDGERHSPVADEAEPQFLDRNLR